MSSINKNRLAGSSADHVKAAWQQFVETVEPIRPELYRYCRYLTRNAWDAEDLVQDALARCLVILGCLFQEIDNPRAWLFRVASNLWIDRQRRQQTEVRHEIAASTVSAVESNRLSLEGREAAATLIGRLSPQERAAVLLKDVFDFAIEDIAAVLATTPGAVKAALHRGRGKLETQPTPSSPPQVDRSVIDGFCEAFNARDIERLVSLLLDTASAEIVGIATEYGPAKMRQSDTGSLYHTLFSPIAHAVLPEFRSGDRGGLARAERRDYRDEPIIVAWYDEDAGPVVRDVIRLRTEGTRVAAIRYHFFSPDVVADVCGELGLPFRSNGYRYWPAI